MYNTVGARDNLTNVCLLAKKYCSGPLKSNSDLKKAYLEFLAAFQPACPHPNHDGDIFVRDVEVMSELAALFRTEARLDDRQQSKLLAGQFTSDEIEAKIETTKLALEKMKSSMPEVYKLFHLVIHSVFFWKAEGAGGGSTSTAVGVIWLNNRDHWSVQDTLEVLLHEMTHNLVFIDEVCHLHYTDYDKMALPENYAQSAILKVKRPLDKVVHSIVVATEVLVFRASVLGELKDPKAHPPSHLLLEQTAKSVQGVLAQGSSRDLLTKRGLELMELCQVRLIDLAKKIA